MYSKITKVINLFSLNHYMTLWAFETFKNTSWNSYLRFTEDQKKQSGASYMIEKGKQCLVLSIRRRYSGT